MKKLMLLFLVVILVFTSCKGTNSDDKTNESASLLYKNYECGYQITFPESWDGWYAVDNPDENVTRIKFVGKSKTGSIAGKEYFGGGLPMFFIVSEKYLDANSTPMDSLKKIGTSGGIDYYYATGTGSDITALLEIADENSAVRQTAKYNVDEEELQLAAADWEKVQEMQEEVEEILQTFTEFGAEK